jgi:hypothetical protein
MMALRKGKSQARPWMQMDADHQSSSMHGMITNFQSIFKKKEYSFLSEKASRFWQDVWRLPEMAGCMSREEVQDYWQAWHLAVGWY